MVQSSPLGQHRSVVFDATTRQSVEGPQQKPEATPEHCVNVGLEQVMLS